MKRVLLTGMSGGRKSSVVRELIIRGYKAVDTDDGWSEPQLDGRQRWREDAIQSLLATEDSEILFIAGCEENQVRFHSQFDHIVLLSAPMETLIPAWRPGPTMRTARHPRSYVASSTTSKPWSRYCCRMANHEVRTTATLNEVVTTILRLVDA